MIVDGVLALLNKGMDLAFPDTKEADAAKARLSEMALNGELQGLQNQFEVQLAQIRVNEKAAEHGDLSSLVEDALSFYLGVRGFCLYRDF